MTDEPTTFNKFGVGSVGTGEVVITKIGMTHLSKDDALTLAVWLVAMADPGGQRFEGLWKTMWGD